MNRLLITGSRDWTNKTEIELAIRKAIGSRSGMWILIHGACPTGADKIAADIFSRECSWPIEAYPADWLQFGKRAGFVRNAYMVGLGADLCLAFIKNQSKGATMTANLAEEAGIETWRYIETGPVPIIPHFPREKYKAFNEERKENHHVRHHHP